MKSKEVNKKGEYMIVNDSLDCMVDGVWLRSRKKKEMIPHQKPLSIRPQGHLLAAECQ